MEIILYILLALLVIFLLVVGYQLFSVLLASYLVYAITLVRWSKKQWGRRVSLATEDQLKMDAEGMEWHEANKDKKQDVHIVNKKLNLYGEYYDLGYDRAVIILSGRTESLRYGYYFARPYAESAFNILVIDPRAHGLSDGRYNTVGFEESGDAMAWARFLNEEYGIETVIFHGICIGACAGMLASTSPDCPECVKGLVTEGMFIRFAESMRNNLIARNKPADKVLPLIDFWMKLHTGHSMMYGPIDVIDKFDKPLLMLQSKEDKYSTPQNAQMLYDKCQSTEKNIVWFERGAHSHIRVTDTAAYDSAIKEFLNRVFA